MLDVLSMSVATIRREAEQRARQVLDEHWTDRLLPVDPVEIAWLMGVEVFSVQLGNDTFGMLINRPEGAQIYADVDQPPSRYRFTVAHELGHLVERAESLVTAAEGHEVLSAEEVEEIITVDRRSDADRGEPREIFANHFAGALLMPAQEVERELSMWRNDTFRTADRFGVSPSALQYRRTVIRYGQ